MSDDTQPETVEVETPAKETTEVPAAPAEHYEGELHLTGEGNDPAPSGDSAE